MTLACSLLSLLSRSGCPCRSVEATRAGSCALLMHLACSLPPALWGPPVTGRTWRWVCPASLGTCATRAQSRSRLCLFLRFLYAGDLTFTLRALILMSPGGSSGFLPFHLCDFARETPGTFPTRCRWPWGPLLARWAPTPHGTPHTPGQAVVGLPSPPARGPALG